MTYKPCSRRSYHFLTSTSLSLCGYDDKFTFSTPPPPTSHTHTKMEFGVGKVQMKFLHLLSNEASHRVTLHCLNDPPYSPADSFSSTGRIHKENTTLQFHGWNKHMFEKETLFEPHVLQDDCKVIGRTVIPQTFILLSSLELWHMGVLSVEILASFGCGFCLFNAQKRVYLFIDLHYNWCDAYLISGVLRYLILVRPLCIQWFTPCIDILHRNKDISHREGTAPFMFLYLE